jgi:hypothetical protein
VFKFVFGNNELQKYTGIQHVSYSEKQILEFDTDSSGDDDNDEVLDSRSENVTVVLT